MMNERFSDSLKERLAYDAGKRHGFAYGMIVGAACGAAIMFILVMLKLKVFA